MVYVEIFCWTGFWERGVLEVVLGKGFRSMAGMNDEQ